MTKHQEEDNRELRYLIRQLKIEISELKGMLTEVADNLKDVVTTERNSSAVRKGYCISGSLMHYTLAGHIGNKLKNYLYADKLEDKLCEAYRKAFD